MALVVQAKNRKAPHRAGWLTNIVKVCHAPLFDKSIEPVAVWASSWAETVASGANSSDSSALSAWADAATAAGANRSRPSQANAKITATNAPAPKAATRQLNK